MIFIPCSEAKHFLAVSASDIFVSVIIRAVTHFLSHRIAVRINLGTLLKTINDCMVPSGAAKSTVRTLQENRKRKRWSGATLQTGIGA